MKNHYYADMHVHIGRDWNQKPVKITGAKNLTLTNILIESSRNKGIDLIGVIDCHVPAVIDEIKQLIHTGKASELKEGGIQFEEVTLILGSEIEVYDPSSTGPIHVLCYLPTIEAMEFFSNWLDSNMKNIHLSTQRIYATAIELQMKIKEAGGLFIPAHIFTPFKSLYGKGVKQSMTEILDPARIDAVELGLSPDTWMADQISELKKYTFLTNSDAHSLGKIAREYQEIQMEKPSFTEFKRAIHGIHGRKIIRNYGMNPKLGKYNTTVCQTCYTPVPYKTKKCPSCNSNKIVQGVYDRIQELSDAAIDRDKRPPYYYQVPLEYLPKLGPKTYEKLLDRFGTEMHVIHHASFEQLIEIIPPKLAQSIIDMRNGKLSIQAGGGGKYGKVY